MTQGFSGVGKVTSHVRTGTGGKGIGTFWGNCPKFDLAFTPNSVERNESMSVSRSPLRRMTQNTGATLTLVTDEFNKANAAQALLARVDEVSAGGSVNHTFPSGAVVGDVLGGPDQNVTAVVVTDSTGTPKTLTLDVNYSLDAFSNHITLLDLTTGGPFTQPLKVAYTKGAVSVISGMTEAAQELWLSIAGTNADNGQRFHADVYRVRMDMTKLMSWINSDYNDFELTGSALVDSTKTAAAVGGQVFKMVLDAAHE